MVAYSGTPILDNADFVQDSPVADRSSICDPYLAVLAGMKDAMAADHTCIRCAIINRDN